MPLPETKIDQSPRTAITIKCYMLFKIITYVYVVAYILAAASDCLQGSNIILDCLVFEIGHQWVEPIIIGCI